MKRRFVFIKPREQLLGGAHAGVAQFALKEAVNASHSLVLCVHVKRDCEVFLNKAFGAATSKKLMRERSVVDGVPVCLESTATLKKRYANEPAVYLLFFPSPGLLEVVEEAVDGSAIVVFTEEANSAHVESWCQEFSSVELAIQG